jgi:hypothetical protein
MLSALHTFGQNFALESKQRLFLGKIEGYIVLILQHRIKIESAKQHKINKRSIQHNKHVNLILTSSYTWHSVKIFFIMRQLKLASVIYSPQFCK